jgi:methionyl-tRNA formyltransferase
MTSGNQDKRVYVIATSRSWNEGMAERLMARTGRDFVVMTSKEDLTVENLTAMDPEIIFFPHWSYRIDPGIFSRFESIIFHMTDLPFGRGGSPLQNLIVRGIYETKISALRCVEEMDGGPIYLKKPLSLHGSAEEIFLRASGIIEEMVVEILEKNPKPVPQQGEPTPFKRRRPEESNLASASSLDQLFDMIRMLDAEGYPKAFLEFGPFRLEFTRSARKEDQVVADVRFTLTKNKKREIDHD